MPLYPVPRQVPAPPPASEDNAVPAPGLLTEAAARAETKAAIDALGATINELRAKLIQLGDLR